MARLPLEPESIADLTWGLSLYFSSDKQEKKYGERNMEGWYEIRNRFEQDPTATRFLDNVSAAMSGAIYSLSNTRKEQGVQLASAETLRDRRIKNLDDIANLSKDGLSVVSRLASVSVGGVSFLSLTSSALGPVTIVYAILGGSLAYIVVDILLKWHRIIRSGPILEDSERKRKEIERQFKVMFKNLMDDFLVKIKKLADEFYPEVKLDQARIESIASATSERFSSSVYASGGTTRFGPIWQIPPPTTPQNSE